MSESDRILHAALGRRVTNRYHNETGTIREWAPFGGAGTCDVRLQRDDGSFIWTHMSSCLPTDSKGPLPKREDVCRVRDAEVLESLERIRASAVKEAREKDWPGFNWAKVTMMRSIDGAIDETRRRLQRDTDGESP